MSDTHEHFCQRCFGAGPRGVRNTIRGWWRCNAKPCGRKEQALCKKHLELDAKLPPYARLHR